MKDFIEKEDRASRVRDYNYGDIETYGLDMYDIPVFATIEYRNGEVIFEDYSKLDEYLLTKFIPEKAVKKVYKSSNNKDENLQTPYLSIKLKELIKLQLSEKELKHAIEFIQNQGIHIGGLSQDLDGDFLNYDYITTHNTINFIDTLPWEEMKQKFEDYYITRDENLKKTLVELNMRLVPYVTWKMARYYDIDKNELDSYGYEGLINAVENFNPKKNTKFSTYAISYIKGYVLRAIPQLKGLNGDGAKKIFYRFYKVKKIIEEESGKKLETNPEIFDEIIDVMQEYYDIRISDFVKKELFSVFAKKESLNQLSDEYGVEPLSDTENLFVTKIEFEDFSKNINEILSILNERESFIIRELYGLDDNNPKTVIEVARKLNISAVRVIQIRSSSIFKIRRYMFFKNRGLFETDIYDNFSKYNDYMEGDDYLSHSHKTAKK